MSLHFRFSTALLLAGTVLLCAAPLRAADPSTQFNPKINAWAEGTILTLNADSGNFVIRGSKKPYASAYANMLREIKSKTSDLTGAERQAKEEEIRQAWSQRLNDAQNKPADKDSDFTFSLPSKNDPLLVYDERPRYGFLLISGKAPQNLDTNLSKDELAALRTLQDFRVGENVVVGYESGLLYNTAHTLIRISQRQTHSSSTYSTHTTPSTNPDLVITAKVRRSIVNDDSLSTYAHNIRIITHDGIVTLRGPVPTEEERKAIESKASSIVGKENVKNKTEVVTNL